jgi:hypothetical protein
MPQNDEEHEKTTDAVVVLLKFRIWAVLEFESRFDRLIARETNMQG